MAFKCFRDVIGLIIYDGKIHLRFLESYGDTMISKEEPVEFYMSKVNNGSIRDTFVRFVKNYVVNEVIKEQAKAYLTELKKIFDFNTDTDKNLFNYLFFYLENIKTINDKFSFIDTKGERNFLYFKGYGASFYIDIIEEITLNKYETPMSCLRFFSKDSLYNENNRFENYETIEKNLKFINLKFVSLYKDGMITDEQFLKFIKGVE